MPLMVMRLPSSIDHFFFQRIPAIGFPLMRIAWAFVTGAFLLMQWKDISYYYSAAGLITNATGQWFMRSNWHFTLLEWIDQPHAVFALYLILLTTLFCMMIGLWPRIMTITSVLLLYTFHEFNTMILGGGDTLLRNIGFILMIAPGIGGFSVSRLEKQWMFWKKQRRMLPQLTMPIWPWRMLLWQMIILYSTSLWYKLLGTMWLNGTAVEATFHHPVYTRWPGEFMNALMPLVGTADYLALFWQAGWLLLLVPQWLVDLLPPQLPRIPLRRILMVGGIFFHGGIVLFMDAGVFSLAVWTAYLGMLREEDFKWMKQLMGSRDSESYKLKAKSSIIVLYDGHCGLCIRSLFTLQQLDWLNTLAYMDFRDEAQRKKTAPEITLEELDRAMHILLPIKKREARGQRPEALSGFYAFRRLTWSLPPLWPLAPFLYIPGVPLIGRLIYSHIAANRKKCDHEDCAL